MTHDSAASLTELRDRLGVIADLTQASALMSWDQRTYLPPKGNAGRSRAIATIGRLRHDRMTDPSLADVLASLEAADLEGDDAALVRETRRDVDLAARLPRELVGRAAEQFSLAETSWAAARAHDDFASFAPVLRENLVIVREIAQAHAAGGDLYDALHDLYERDSTAAAVEAVFTPLRAELVELVGEIRERGRSIDVSPLLGAFDEGRQERFNLGVARAFGYDLDGGRLDRTTHPFASGIGRGDVRITTRYKGDDLRGALFPTLHEAGHGIYEQNLPAEHAGTPLGRHASLGVHESQSRLWENLVGRSLPFWEWAYPRLQETFPDRLGAVDLEAFHAAMNVVEPSLIRVEADEVTYHLHVMIRFELERALLEGSLDVDDLPGAWNERYEAYLGITPPDDRRGCLQDVHWAGGMIGYFPTYSLGTLLSAQLWEALRRDLGDVDDAMRRGEFGGILSWLIEHVHRHGRRYTPAELTRRATGAELSAEPYLRYAREKYGTIYGL
jgi:carboxypeptidase Taq